MLTTMNQRTVKFEVANTIFASSVINNSDIVFDAGK